MKKSRIFYAVGTLVLAVGGFMATKANKKFATYNTAKVNGISPVTLAASNHFTTIKSAGSRTAFFATKSGSTTTLHTLVTVGTSKQIYYK